MIRARIFFLLLIATFAPQQYFIGQAGAVVKITILILAVVFSAVLVRSLNPVALILLTLPFSFLIDYPVTVNVHLSYLITPIVVLHVFSRRFRDEPLQIRGFRLFLLAWSILVALSFGTSTLLSPSVTASGMVALLKMSIVLIFLMTTVKALGGFRGFRTISSENISLLTFMMGTLALLGLGELALISLGAPIEDLFLNTDRRITLGHPNPNLTFLVLLLGLSLLTAYTPHSLWSTKSVVCLGGLAAAWFTESSSGHLAILSGAVLIAVSSVWLSRLRRYSLVAIATIVGLAAQSYLPRPSFLRSETAVSGLTEVADGLNLTPLATQVIDDSRWTLWQSYWSVFLEHLWFGVGPDISGVVPETSSLPHNTYLLLLVSYGLVGLAIFLSFPLLTVGRLVASREHAGVILGISLVAVGVFGLGHDLLYNPVLWMLVALAFAYRKSGEPHGTA